MIAVTTTIPTLQLSEATNLKYNLQLLMSHSYQHAIQLLLVTTEVVAHAALLLFITTEVIATSLTVATCVNTGKRGHNKTIATLDCNVSYHCCLSDNMDDHTTAIAALYHTISIIPLRI